MRKRGRRVAALVAAALSLLLLLLPGALRPASAQTGPDDEAPPPLGELERSLVEGDLAARLRAVGWLAADDSARATAALELAALDLAPDVRRLALAALGPRTIDAAILAEAARNDPDALVRVAAVAAAARRDEPERAAVLVAALEDGDVRVRTSAAENLAALSRTHWPDCLALAELWRAAGARDDSIEREALAALLEPQVVSASACGLSEDEYRAVYTDAVTYGRFTAAPELGLAQRNWRERLEAQRRRMLELQDALGAELEVICLEPLAYNYGEFFALAVEAGMRIDEAMASAPGTPGLTRNVLDLLALLDRYNDELAACIANPDPYAYSHNPYIYTPSVAVEPVHFWMHAGLEALYDDHFLAYREDVENLRVTDQMAQRLVARAQLNSRALIAGLPLPRDDEPVARLRAELAQELYDGESQLSGPSGWLEGYFHVRLDEYPDVFVYGISEGGYARGWRDLGLPWQLVAPMGGWRSQVGVTVGEADEPQPWLSVALGSEGQFYDAADDLTPSRALSGDSPPTGATAGLVPPEIDDANRTSVDGRIRWTPLHDPEFGVFVDLGARAWFYPQGMPTLSSAGVYSTRADGPAVHTAPELGLWYADSEFFVIGQLGATLSVYPEPHTGELATFSGRIYMELPIDSRASDGGRLFADVWRRVDDAPGLGDALAHSGGRSGISVWENDSDGVIEFNLGALVEHATRHLEVPDSVLDPSFFRAGFATALVIDYAALPTFALSWQLLGEQNFAREPHYLNSLGDSEDRPLLRNLVMLSVYMGFGGPNTEFLDERSPEWGLPRVLGSAVPALWWWQP